MKSDEIKSIRKEFGYNQSAFAKVLGVSRQYLSDIENNKEPISDNIKQKIYKLKALII